MVDNARTKARIQEISGEAAVLDPFQAFYDFYKEMQQCALTCEEEQIIAEIIGVAREES